MAFFAIFVSFVANTTVLDRQRPAGLREVLRSSHESVHATIPVAFRDCLTLCIARDTRHFTVLTGSPVTSAASR